MIGAAPARAEPVGLVEAVRWLPVDTESREGYERTKFRHWVDTDPDGCNTRAEVLLTGAVEQPAVDASCRITSASWFSYYDQVPIDTAGTLDIDHMVPLAEAWDSGASQWTAARRQAYTPTTSTPNAPSSLSPPAPTAPRAIRTPPNGCPPADSAPCTYTAGWVTTKLRWHLTVDDTELATLQHLAAGCPDTVIDHTPAP